MCNTSTMDLILCEIELQSLREWTHAMKDAKQVSRLVAGFSFAFHVSATCLTCCRVCLQWPRKQHLRNVCVIFKTAFIASFEVQ